VNLSGCYSRYSRAAGITRFIRIGSGWAAVIPARIIIRREQQQPYGRKEQGNNQHTTKSNRNNVTEAKVTADQAAQIEPHLRHGWTLLGKIEREGFNGTNGETCGRLVIELGSVPTSALPRLREAIRNATAPAPKRKLPNSTKPV
jgi:hypothetical protein